MRWLRLDTSPNGVAELSKAAFNWILKFGTGFWETKLPTAWMSWTFRRQRLSKAVTHFGLSQTIFCHPQLWAIPHGSCFIKKFTGAGETICVRRAHLKGARAGPCESITVGKQSQLGVLLHSYHWCLFLPFLVGLHEWQSLIAPCC